LLIVATVSGTLAMIQFVINYLRYRQTGLEKDDPMIADRAVGFMSHWMTFSVGEMLVWCAAIPVIVVLSRRWLVPAVITGAAIILSFTRGVWIGSAAGLFSVVFALPRKVIVMILAPAAVVMLLASWPIYHRLSMSFQQGFAPDEGRQALLRAGVSMVRDNPLFGVGPERVSREFPNYHPKKEDLGRFYYGHMENNYMQIAAERGLITLGAFLWFFVELFRELWALRREKSEMSRTAALSGLAALAAFLVAGLFSYDFGDSESLLLFLFLVSAPLGLARRTAESTKHAKR
jgi:O-antigen ligase